MNLRDGFRFRFYFQYPVNRAHLGEAAAVLSQDVRVGTIQFPDDLEALVELCKDVHHRAGEQRMLRCLLELRRCRVGTGKQMKKYKNSN